MLASSALRSGPVMTALEARSVRSDPAEENWRLRQNLALSYRIINDLSLNEGSCNHLSVMAPAASGSGEEVMLIGEMISQYNETVSPHSRLQHPATWSRAGASTGAESRPAASSAWTGRAPSWRGGGSRSFPEPAFTWG